MALLFWSAMLNIYHSFAQVDTLRVMAYNVLYYGDVPACQGGHSLSHGYLKSIVAYTSPDILGLEKMAAIPMFPGDHSGTAPAGFADSVLQFALNAAYPGRYNYCSYTNTSGADNISILFFNTQKLGFSGILASYSNTTDFNTYKLYYKSPALAVTHDTVFLYVTLNHTESGSGSGNESARAAQIAGEMAQLHLHFTQLPNVINMGDFNTHHSTEACYQDLVAPSNPAFRFYDPPFSPDATYTYPADWDTNPSSYAACLTTSTRYSSSIPNSCGTSGGGKSWYDHIFLSDAIINNSLNVRYIPHSYSTIGNDSNRVGISINDLPANTAAPSVVIDALFQMSNKYPVMVSLEVSSPVSGLNDVDNETSAVTAINPFSGELTLNFHHDIIGKQVHIQCIDVTGRLVVNSDLKVVGTTERVPFDTLPGIYYLTVTTVGGAMAHLMINKQ